MSKRLKHIMDFLAYFSMVADTFIAIANIITYNLPKNTTYDYYFFSGSMVINTTAINSLGQWLIVFIIPLTAILWIVYMINNHIEKIQEKRLFESILDFPKIKW